VTRPLLPALVACLACAALAVPGSARAQDAATKAAMSKEADRASALLKEARTSARAAGTARPAKSGRKVIKLDTLTIEGRIQKPEAFYVLPRSNLAFDELQKTESFVPKIEKSVQKDPF
jgi:hypothetical protein